MKQHESEHLRRHEDEETKNGPPQDGDRGAIGLPGPRKGPFTAAAVWVADRSRQERERREKRQCQNGGQRRSAEQPDRSETDHQDDDERRGEEENGERPCEAPKSSGQQRDGRPSHPPWGQEEDGQTQKLQRRGKAQEVPAASPRAFGAGGSTRRKSRTAVEPQISCGSGTSPMSL